MFNLQPYLDQEIQVLPLDGKFPAIKKGETWKNVNFLEIHEKFTWKGGGLICGEKSGIIALDFDSKNYEIKERIKKIIPPILSARLGNRDKLPTMFFTYNEETSLKLKNIQIERLSDGRYCCLPDSPHPDFDYNFKWEGRPLFEVLDQLPHLDKSVWNALVDLNEEYAAPHLKIIDEENGRNNTLKDQVVAGLHGGKNPFELAQEIVDYDKKHHESPLFTDIKEGMLKDPFNNALKFIFSIGLSQAKARDVTFQKPAPNVVILSEGNKEEKNYYKGHKLPKLRGIAQDIFKYTYDSAVTPRSQWAFASAITSVSTIIGNRYKHNGMRPNLYTMIVGESGSGKDHCLKTPQKILLQAAHPEYIGDGQLASASALLSNFKDYIVKINVIDEADLFIKSLDCDQSATRGLAHYLSSLYTHHEGLFLGLTSISAITKECPTGRRGQSMEPYLNMISAINARTFQESVDINMMDQGIMARFLYFIDVEHKRSRLKDRTDIVIPSNVIDWTKEMIGRKGLLEQKEACWREMPFLNLDVESKYKEIFELLEDKKEAAQNNHKIKPIANRLNELFIKMCIIDSASRYNESIDLNTLDWSYEFINSYYLNMSDFLNHHLSYSKSDKQVTTILKIIKESGIKGVTKSQLVLNKDFKRLGIKSVKDRDELLNDLVNIGQIFTKKEGKKVTFFHKNFVKI
jgi:hypothetical protein